MKHYRRVKKLIKAITNHRRIQILDLLDQKPNLSVVDISDKTRANIKTMDAHINRMFAVNMLTKSTGGNHVFHTITPFGESILKFLRKQE